MVDIQGLISLQFQLFLYVSIGFILNRLHIIKSEAKAALTDLVIYIVLPCSIIVSFFIELDTSVMQHILLILFISFIIQFVCLVIAHLLYSKQESSSYSVLKYATICSNSGFMGTPLVQGIYGLPGLLYSSVYLIAVRIFMWSVGLSCFYKSDLKSVLFKVCTHPCIIAVLIGLFFLFADITLPSIVLTSLEGIASSTTFLSMLVIGVILSEAKVTHLLTKQSIAYSVIRLGVIPITVFIGCLFFQVDPLITVVSTVLAGMPAGSTTVILATKYNGNEQLAGQLVFTSTLLSLLTIPILCLGMELFF